LQEDFNELVASGLASMYLRLATSIPQRLSFENRDARWQNIGGFIERRTHHLIAGQRDPACDAFSPD
jgi:hypothetical protein